MATYTDFPVIIDGVRLDSAAWGISAKTRITADSRSGDAAVSGVHGVIPSLNDDLGAASRVYAMWLLGTDDNGAIPGGSNGMATCLANADRLSHLLLGDRWRLRDVREVVDAAGTQRQYFGKVTGATGFDITAGGLGRVTVEMSIPAGVTQDTATADWTSTPTVVSGNALQVTGLAGAAGPIDDAVILVQGPAINPQVNDYASGAYVRLNATLSSSQQWRVNVGTWATRYGTGLTLGSSDTTGTEGWPVTVRGSGNATLLSLQPTLVGGVRVVQVSLIASGITATTAVSVRARRKFLL